MMNFREFVNTQATPETPKWKASKDEIISYWKNLRPDLPIILNPIENQHKGSTYGEDGLRLTGSPQFISSVLARLKEFLNFETPATRLSLTYRETTPPAVDLTGTKTSYVFYLQSKKRGLNAS